MVMKQLNTILGLVIFALPMGAWSNPTLDVVKPLNVGKQEVKNKELPESELIDLDNLRQLARDNATKQELSANDTIREKNKRLNEIAQFADKDEAEILKQIARDKDGLDPHQDIIKGDMYYILISSSMKENEIADILELAQGKEHVTLVIQGFKDKKSLVYEVNHWHELLKKHEKPINFQIDPTIFDKYKITSIPVTIHEKDGAFISLVKGLSNPDFLKGKQGNLGTHGPMLPIAEQNMLNMIQDGLNNLDFEQMKKEAIKRYWKNQTIYPFPTATQNSVHYVDPSVVIPNDIVSPNGQIIAEKGLINPMDIMPFNLKLVFFNPNDKGQREFAKLQYAKSKNQQLQPILIATDVYENGWETFQENDYYGEQAVLYFIQPDMKERFGIERVPSVVIGDGKQFVVREYGKNEWSTIENEKD